MNPMLTGLHHLTAVTARWREFPPLHADAGMRLVKKTVNQDDVRFITSSTATAWPRPAAISPSSTGLTYRKSSGSHTITHGIAGAQRSQPRVGQTRLPKRVSSMAPSSSATVAPCLDFEDFEGQRLALVEDGGLGDGEPWAASPIPAEHQIRGLGPITMTVTQLAPTDLVLTKALAMEEVRTYADPESPRHTVHVFGMEGAGPQRNSTSPCGLTCRWPGLVRAASITWPSACRTKRSNKAWEVRACAGHPDQRHRRSLLLSQHLLPRAERHPFELATDGPGFDVDEPLATLGERLALPPFLEPRRADIEANLKPLAT